MAANRAQTKVLVAGDLWLSSTDRSLADGLRTSNFEVSEIDSRYFVPLWRSLPMRVVGRLIRPFARKEYVEAVCRRLEAERPNVLLAVKGPYLDGSVFDICRQLGVASAIYYTDYHFNHPGVDLTALLSADHFFTTKSFQLEFLRAQKRKAVIHFLHHGYAPSHVPAFHRVSEEDFCRDISYVGTYTPDKARWLSEIRRLLPAAKLEIFGEQWQQASDRAIRDVWRGARYAGAYAETLQRSRINIGLHMEPKGENGWADKVSIRTFEIPACKGFMLHIDNDEIRTLYEPGKEIDVFATPDELAEKIKYYLANPAVRNSMVEAAYARCVPAYSYQRRAEAIMRIVAPQ